MEPSWSLNVTQGEMTSMIDRPWCAMAAFRIACNWRLSPENERATRVAPSWIASTQQSIGVRSLIDAGLQLRAEIRRRRELALGKAVHAVVLDDVHLPDIAAEHVDVLADADRRRIAVAGNRNAEQVPVGEHRAGGDRRRAAMHGVEAVRQRSESTRATSTSSRCRRTWPRSTAARPFRRSTRSGARRSRCARSPRTASSCRLYNSERRGRCGSVFLGGAAVVPIRVPPGGRFLRSRVRASSGSPP